MANFLPWRGLGVADPGHPCSKASGPECCEYLGQLLLNSFGLAILVIICMNAVFLVYSKLRSCKDKMFQRKIKTYPDMVISRGVSGPGGDAEPSQVLLPSWLSVLSRVLCRRSSPPPDPCLTCPARPHHQTERTLRQRGCSENSSSGRRPHHGQYTLGPSSPGYCSPPPSLKPGPQFAAPSCCCHRSTSLGQDQALESSQTLVRASYPPSSTVGQDQCLNRPQASVWASYPQCPSLGQDQFQESSPDSVQAFYPGGPLVGRNQALENSPASVQASCPQSPSEGRDQALESSPASVQASFPRSHPQGPNFSAQSSPASSYSSLDLLPCASEDDTENSQASPAPNPPPPPPLPDYPTPAPSSGKDSLPPPSGPCPSTHIPREPRGSTGRLVPSYQEATGPTRPDTSPMRIRRHVPEARGPRDVSFRHLRPQEGLSKRCPMFEPIPKARPLLRYTSRAEGEGDPARPNGRLWAYLDQP